MTTGSGAADRRPTHDHYPAATVPAPEREFLATANAMCPICSRPVVLDAHSPSTNRDMAPRDCQDSPRSINTWPEGVRHVLCLNCDRAFESESKAQRLCRDCR